MHLLTLFTIFASAYAQTSSPAASATGLPAAVPSCAEPSLQAAIQAAGCQPSDARCICSTPQLFPALVSAIEDVCDQSDQAAVAAFAKTYCGRASASSDTLQPSTTEIAVAPSSTGPDDGTTVAVFTAVSTPSTTDTDATALPSFVTAPDETSSPTALVVDTTSLTKVSTTSMVAAATNATHSATATAKPTNGTHVGGASQQVGQSVATFGFAMAVLAVVGFAGL